MDAKCKGSLTFASDISARYTKVLASLWIEGEADIMLVRGRSFLEMM